jgi:hypothetical protein
MTSIFARSLVSPSRWLGVASLLLLLPVASVAAPHSAPATTDPVRSVAERNIFNPARTPRSSGTEAASNAPPSPVAEVLTLVGVLDDGIRRTAFFDGSSTALRQVLASGGTVAGLTLTEVALHQATLSAGPQTFTLSVGRSLAREPGGAWRAAPDATIGAAPDAASSTVAPASTPSSDANDALRRLKERRRKQLKE